MSERNARMTAMLVAEIPEYDPAFEIAVLERIEKRRFIRSSWLSLTAAVVATLLLALVAPQLNLLWVLGGRVMGDLSAPLSILTGDYVLAAPLLFAVMAAYYSSQADRS